MRYLVYLLLLANLGVFAWLYTHQDDYRPSQPIAPTLPAGVEPLVLLSERSNPPPEMPTEHVAVAAVEPERTQEPSSEWAPEIPPGTVPTPVEEPATQTPDETADIAVPGDAEADTAGPEQDVVTALADDQPTEESAPVAPLPRVCQTIGPFVEREQAEAFTARLEALGQSPVQRSAQVEQPSGYWVYLPSMPRSEARRTVDELAAKGVKDYFLGRQNYISLGIFSDKRMAENRVREIGALGYRPQLEPRFVTREVFWLDFEESGPRYISAEQWRDLLEAQPDLRRQSLACE